MITYGHFKELDIRIAKILVAERVQGSDKLVKLQVSVGEERRQIIAGIGKVYELENLIGREIVIVANLEPKKLMGLESQGMLLAADQEGRPVLLVPDSEVPTGSIVK